jgi:ComF family protein
VDLLHGAVNLDWRRWVDGWRQRLEFALLPAHCLLCRAPSDTRRDLCRACAADLQPNQPCCQRCALPLQRNEPLCGICLKHEPPFAVAWAPYRYAYPLDQLVTRFKFGRDLAAGRVLQELWVAAANAAPPDLPQLLVAIPLHTSRLRERGYNQALELAKPLAQILDVPLAHDLLVRQRATNPQTGLDIKARSRNVKDAFVLNPNAGLPTHIVLLDDVMTTGATLRECARILRRAGVARVDAWALARAPQRGG